MLSTQSGATHARTAASAALVGDSKPIDYNPCLGCNLCVAVCPVGAIKVDQEFDFLACYQHNYRQRMTGFRDWIQRVADSDDGEDYPEHFGEAATAAAGPGAVADGRRLARSLFRDCRA